MNADQKIRDLTDRYIQDVKAAVAESLRENLNEVLGGASAPKAPAATKRLGIVVRQAPKGPKAMKPSTVVDQLPTKDVFAAIKANNGMRTEEIAKTLGTNSKPLKQAIKELVAAGKITCQGKARGTTLHVA